jgi:signal transduction histidine kinase
MQQFIFLDNSPNIAQNRNRQAEKMKKTSAESGMEKIQHLNAVLNAVRDINHLIVKEKNRKKLIQQICESLIKNRGYHNAWIILLDGNYHVIESAEAGLGGNLDPILERIEAGFFTHCCRNVLKKSDFLAIRNPTSGCRDCPVSHMHDGRGAMSARLEHESRVYGILTVSIPDVFSSDPQEHDLFRDVADDIAFALRTIDIEEERVRTEMALREARDKLELRVKERTEELEMLSSKLLSAQEEERKRIAGDLHDGIGQCLSAVKFMVETALDQLNQKVPESDLTSLKALVPLLQEASEEVRTIVMNLRPSILDDLGILATIGWFCRQFQAVYSYIRIEEEIQTAENQIPDSLKTIIFRILQEAMNNVAKHSRANRVYLLLRRRKQRIELVIRDNGRGFDSAGIMSLTASEKGFGITGMKERTELSGGEFAIESEINTGTTVRASWDYSSIRCI